MRTFVACCLLSVCSWADAAGPAEFAAAIDYAQARMVKIYGAGIGRTPGYATGLLVSPDGDILTAQGVQLAADSLRATLPHGETVPAQVMRRSTPLQAALLKIEVKTPEYFDLTTPAVPEGGDWVLAISNAFKVADGAEPLSVNLGVLTLRTRLDARRGVQDFPYEGDVLLVDAITSNPGAAGGAVVGTDGRLAGMIGKVIEGKNTNTRLNYAVPTSLLDAFVRGEESPKVVEASPEVNKSASPGELGIRLFALGGKKAPAFVDRVIVGSPASQAGLKSDDLIVSLNKSAIRNAEDFRTFLSSVYVGDVVEVEVKRKNDLLSFRLTAVSAAGKQ